MCFRVTDTSLFEMRKPCVIFYVGEQCLLRAALFAHNLYRPCVKHPINSRADICAKLINACKRRICLSSRQSADIYLLEDAFVYSVERCASASSQNLNDYSYIPLQAAPVSNPQTSPMLRSIVSAPMIV